LKIDKRPSNPWKQSGTQRKWSKLQLHQWRRQDLVREYGTKKI